MEEEELVALIKQQVEDINKLFIEAGKMRLDVTPSFGYAVTPPDEKDQYSNAVMYIAIKKYL